MADELNEFAAMMEGSTVVEQPVTEQPETAAAELNTEAPAIINDPAPEVKTTPSDALKAEQEAAAKTAPVFDFNKYGLEGEEALAARLAEYQALKEKEAEFAKQKEYAWKSPQEKALADFISGWDGDINEGITTHIRLKSLDVDNMAGKDALKENFILSKLANPNMTRQKAELLFNHKYAPLYERAEDMDEPDEVMKIELEEEEYTAKQALKGKQASIKEAAEKAAQQQEPEQPEIAPEIINAMQREVQSLPEVLKEFESLSFPVGDNPEVAFNAALEKGEIEIVKAEVENVLKNPAFYNADGTIKPEFTAKNVASRLVGAIAWERLVKAALAHNVSLSQIEAMKTIEKSGADRGNGTQGIGHAPRNEYEAMLTGTGRG